jgi:hypothetical protein
MLLRSALFMVSVLLVVPACEREPVALADAEILASSWMNNPDNGNPRISRFEGEAIFCWSDAENGLRACHSTIPLGEGDEADCGPQEVLDPVEVQDVGLFDTNVDFFVNWLRRNAKGQVWITVRDETQPGTCFDNELIAEGWGEFHINDNDVFGTLPDDHNANAWGFRAQGRLTTPEGGTVAYNGHLHFRFNNAAGFQEIAPQVSVH